MAYFGDAFKKLSIKEGGYVNDKDDAGGETYRGIRSDKKIGTIRKEAK